MCSALAGTGSRRVQRADRIINLSGGFFDLAGAQPDLLAAWRAIAESN
ncbi:MAG: hypothetical protein R3E79_02330 [Caldilineaceae bacterium]